MYPRIMHICGPLWIQSYGLMLIVGVISFFLLTHRLALRKRIMSDDDFVTAIFLTLLSGVAGAKLLSVITEWSSYKNNLITIFQPWEGGFSILGGIIGVLLVVPFYLRSRGINPLYAFDLAAAYVPCAQAIGRIGCLLAGCCYGLPALPGTLWTITFTNPVSYLPEDLLGIALYPTQLYACFASFTIFILLAFVLRNYLPIVGQRLGLYLMLENMARFLVDFWRADQANVALFVVGDVALSDMQVVALALGIVGALWFIMCSYQARERYQPSDW